MKPMLKQAKRTLSLLLVLLMLVNVFPLTSLTVVAEDTAGTHSHPVCGTTCSCSDSHSNQIWQPFPADTTTLTSGNYYLKSSIKFTGLDELTINGDVSICLNGYRIYKNGTSGVVSVKSGTLTLTDCKEKGAVSVTSNDKTFFSGAGALSLGSAGSLEMYGGTVSCDALGSAIYCSTTGNLTIYNGNVTAYYSAIDIHKVNNVAIISGNIIGSNDSGISCEYGTFNNIDISGGCFEGAYNGVCFGQFTCNGKVTISGGDFYGKGPVPNATTYGYWYYGLAFGNSNGGNCNLTILGGTFRGARGGFYSYNPQLNATVSGGVFNAGSTIYNGSSSGITADNGTFLIEGGTIYGIQHSSSYTLDTRVTVTGGEIYCIQGNSGSSGKFTLKVYGGTIGRAGTAVAKDGIVSSSANIEVCRGTILGTEYAISYAHYSSNPSGSVLVSGGELSGGVADIFMGGVGTTPTNTHLSMEGYEGSPVTVALSSYSISNNASVLNIYIARNVSADNIIDIIPISDSQYFTRYDSINKAVYITKHSHSYSEVVTPQTCENSGYTTYTCSCGDTYVDNYTDPLGHDYVIHEAKNATCLDFGWNEYETCSRCDYTTYVEIPATGEHAWSEWETTIEPTTTTEGEETRVCSVCGEVETQSIPVISGVVKYAVEGGYIYFDTETGTVIDCDESVTKADIPSQINGVGVTSIGGQAFSDCELLKSITLPDSVMDIDYEAFDGCKLLESIIIPDGVTCIHFRVFANCYSLEEVIIPDSVIMIQDYAFLSCLSLESINIPDSVTSVGEYAFMYCTALESIVIPDGVTCIDEGVFYGCHWLTSITIPNSVTSIGAWAFTDCQKLEFIAIPHTVIDIREYAFYNCNSLRSITIPEGVTSIEANTFAYCDSVESITIPDSVTTIGKAAFNRCWKSLTSITIPEGVTSIGAEAFAECFSLESIVIPNSVISIGTRAFFDCRSLDLVYYCGDSDSWNEISIKNNNEDLTNATIIYHNYTDWETISEANCLTEGEETRTCIICSKIETQAIPATGEHIYGEWQITVEPTITTEGEKVRYCLNCGESESETIPMLPNENAPQIIVSNVEGRAGETVTVTVELKNNPGFAGMNAYLTYADGLVLSNVENSTSLTFSDGKTMLWDGVEDHTGDGELLKLTFDISESAEVGEYFIKFNFMEAYDIDLEDVIFTTVDGYINVVDFIYGDVNGDAEINTKDIILLRKYITARDPITGECDIEVSHGVDVNGDGVINTKDVILLRKYITARDPITGESSVVLGPAA